MERNSRAHELEFQYRTLKHAQGRDDGSFLARMFIGNIQRRIKELEKYGKNMQMDYSANERRKEKDENFVGRAGNFLRRYWPRLPAGFSQRQLGSQKAFLDVARWVTK
jgi:hypothetical protein